MREMCIWALDAFAVLNAQDYCGHHKNAGALLFVRRDLTIVPKSAAPVCACSTSGRVGSIRLIYPVERMTTMWDPMVMQQRPPTPPRPVRASHVECIECQDSAKLRYQELGSSKTSTPCLVFFPLGDGLRACRAMPGLNGELGR